MISLLLSIIPTATMDLKKEIEASEPENDGKFKSKNLKAERKRREKINNRLYELRSLVPNISNMNKAAIFTDAIEYIEKLKRTVDELSNQLSEMEDTKMPIFEEMDNDLKCEQEMRKWGIKSEVEVKPMGGGKLWIKIVFVMKRGGITRLMEAVKLMGYDVTDTSITASRGAFLVCLSAEESQGAVFDHNPDQIREFLWEVIRS